MIVAYARTSTIDQVHGLQSQIEELTEAGCEKFYSEQVSSVGARSKLDEAIEFVRDGDVLVVTKIDRLARSVSHLWKIIEILQSKQVSLRILNLNLDTSSATGKLMLTMMGAIAAFEREIMLERQKEGIQKALQAGKKFGRPATARQKTDEVRKLRKQGLGASEIARQLGISRASVYRLIQPTIYM